MKSYPYIGQYQTTNTVTTVLYYKQDCCIHMDDREQKTTDRYNEGTFKNITHEYLKNTWGIAESKEHAEFIIELAENAGFDCDDFDCHTFDCDRAYFYTTLDSLDFVSSQCVASDDGEKQITITLLPKEPLKNAGDNLILGCEDSKCDEWPKIGDKAAFTEGVKVTILGIDGEYAWVSCRPSSREKPCTVKISDLQKPKTPEEELFDAFWREVGLFMNQSNLNKDIFKSAFINNITKKPQ